MIEKSSKTDLPMVKLSVVIPTFNRRNVLEQTIPALLAQDMPPDGYEIIVVMDGSTDGTAELLRGFNTKCVLRVLQTPTPHRGAGAARNVGIRAANGELILFLDDDFIAAPDLLRQHYMAHSGADALLVFGAICVAPNSSPTIMRYVTELHDEEWYCHLNPALQLRFPEPTPSPLTITVISFLVNASVSRELLLRAGGFDEQFLAAGDLELGLRLWKMGIAYRYQPAAVASEIYVKSAQQHLALQAKAVDGDLRASRKHPEYRPYSMLAAMAESGAIKSWLRTAIMCSPVSPAPLLTFPLRAERQLYRYLPLRKAGARLLAAAERIVRLRAIAKTAGSREALQSEFGRSLPALMYHHVGPLHSGIYRYLTVTPEQFERQIRWLAHNGYVGIRPSDWLLWRREGRGLPDKPVLITFDDAYQETAEYALPILQRYGFCAVVYVVTGQLGGTNEWDAANGCATFLLMTAEQIRYWDARGFEFGAHTRTHPDLTKLSALECLAEVQGSKNDLSAVLGKPVVSFAYPYGKCNKAAQDLVRSEFDLACGIEEGINYLRGDPHLLRRAYVGPEDSLIEFALSVRLGGLKSFRKWRERFRLRSRLRKVVKRMFPFWG